MASVTYTSFLTDAVKGNIDLDVDSFKMMLVASSYAPNPDHKKRSDITGEVTGAGYTAGGAAVTLTPTQDDANNRLSIACSNPSWANSTITARYGVIYKARGGAATADELVACIDFGADVASSGGAFSVTVSTPMYVTV